MTVSVSYLSKNCTTCLFISKSFKELFFMAFVSKADAKVRTIFITTKLFRRFFQKKFFSNGKLKIPIFAQLFNSSAFLSRKRVQNYCFITYLPNIICTFLLKICILSRKHLIYNYVVQHKILNYLKRLKQPIP